jgi:urease subunit gamma/beta
MHLGPREVDKLLVHQAGVLAQKRLARGLRLSYPEAVALISTQLLELIRDGRSVSDLMQLGKTLLGRQQVLPGVPEMIREVQVEGTFEDGTKLVTVHDPICRPHGDLVLALYGSFLPVPPLAVFGEVSVPTAANDSFPPGARVIVAGQLVLNEGRDSIELLVENHGDRPIQVGSHYPFADVNGALVFDRARAAGRRLDIPAGTAVRFEPGDKKTVRLVAVSGGALD